MGGGNGVRNRYDVRNKRSNMKSEQDHVNEMMIKAVWEIHEV